MQCHISPFGGGARTPYGMNVFQQTDLSVQWSDAEPEGGSTPLSGQVTDWLSLGADIRAAYLHLESEKGAVPGAQPPRVDSFFLMQADLYATAVVSKHVTLALDTGIYGGFEAWLLLQTKTEPNLMLRVGHFMPGFGIRAQNHDLYTRGGIGFVQVDKDTGVELLGSHGPLLASLSLVNGTYAGALFDTRGTEERSFEKALAGRVALSWSNDFASLQAGGSVYWNDNVDAANPLFAPGLTAAQTPLVKKGVDELRAGAFAIGGLGRFSYEGEWVYVRDRFEDTTLGSRRGWAMSNDLGARIVQGLELSAMLEIRDPDPDKSGSTDIRIGGYMQFFFSSYAELMTLLRHTYSPSAPTGDQTDLIVFVHGFF